MESTGTHGDAGRHAGGVTVWNEAVGTLKVDGPSLESWEGPWEGYQQSWVRGREGKHFWESKVGVFCISRSAPHYVPKSQTWNISTTFVSRWSESMGLRGTLRTTCKNSHRRIYKHGLFLLNAAEPHKASRAFPGMTGLQAGKAFHKLQKERLQEFLTSAVGGDRWIEIHGCVLPAPFKGGRCLQQ